MCFFQPWPYDICRPQAPLPAQPCCVRMASTPCCATSATRARAPWGPGRCCSTEARPRWSCRSACWAMRTGWPIRKRWRGSMQQDRNRWDFVCWELEKAENPRICLLIKLIILLRNQLVFFWGGKGYWSFLTSSDFEVLCLVLSRWIRWVWRQRTPCEWGPGGVACHWLLWHPRLRGFGAVPVRHLDPPPGSFRAGVLQPQVNREVQQHNEEMGPGPVGAWNFAP